MINLPTNLSELDLPQFRAVYQAAIDDCMDDPHSNSLIRAHAKCLERYPALQKEFDRRQALSGEEGAGKEAVIDNAARARIKASANRLNAASALGLGPKASDSEADDAIQAAGDLESPNYKAAFSKMVDATSFNRQVSRSAADSIVRSRHPILSIRSDAQRAPVDSSGFNKTRTGLNAFTPAGAAPLANSATALANDNEPFAILTLATPDGKMDWDFAK